MKWRNQLLALLCLVVFFAFGVFYFQYWVIQKPFGIILFIAEGLDARTLTAARLRAEPAKHALALDSFSSIALLKNHSANSAVPDPAAAATALATGVRVPNGAVATDAEGQPLVSLMTLARDGGRATGLITDGRLTSLTAAAFYGHATSGAETPDFASQLVEKGAIDLVLGAGAADFLPNEKGGGRADGLDLVAAMRAADYNVVDSLSDLEAVARWRGAKIFGVFPGDELPLKREDAEAGEAPTLADLVRRGIELLQFHRGGYLLVIDVTLMRKAQGETDSERRLEELLAFDRAVAVATEYAGKKSAIIICSDVAAQEHADTQPTTTAAAPHPLESTPEVEGNAPDLRPLFSLTNAPNVDSSLFIADPSMFPPVATPEQLAAAFAPRSFTKPEDVLAFGTGLGTEDLRGVRESTAVFELLRDNL